MLTNLGIIQRKQGKMDAAYGSFTRAIELEPGNGLPYANRGILLMMQNQVESGLADLEASVEHTPEFSTFRINLGTGYERAKRPADALAQYEQATQLDPNDQTAWKYLGALRLVENDAAGAIEALTQAIELQPRFAEALYWRAKAHLHLQQRNKAAQDARAAHALGYQLDATTLQLLK